jgi:hypothetical protein
MKRIFYIAVISFVLSLCCDITRTYAQRCLPKTVGIGVRSGFTDGIRRPMNFYTDIVVCVYSAKSSRWIAGAGYQNKRYAYRKAYVPKEQFAVESGYQFCLVSDRSKSFFLYVGGSAMLGYEMVNRNERLLYDGAMLRKVGSFLYGGLLNIEAEAYLCDRVTVFIDVRERCLLGGSAGKFHAQFGAGLRFIIN